MSQIDLDHTKYTDNLLQKGLIPGRYEALHNLLDISKNYLTKQSIVIF